MQTIPTVQDLDLGTEIKAVTICNAERAAPQNCQEEGGQLKVRNESQAVRDDWKFLAGVRCWVWI